MKIEAIDCEDEIPKFFRRNWKWGEECEGDAENDEYITLEKIKNKRLESIADEFNRC